MYGSNPRRTALGGFGMGQGPPPRDIIVLLAVVFVTFSMQFFETTAVIPALLRITPAVWRAGFLWQLATYPFAGMGPASLWFLLELLILFWFSRDVFNRLGQKRFWSLLAWSAVGAGVVAVVVDVLASLSGGGSPTAFTLMQGQRMLLAITVAAFATLYGHATIYLFFVLPIQARWFLPLEILFAFMGFLNTRDFPGFLGICAGVGITWGILEHGSPRRTLRELWLKGQQRWIQLRLRRLRAQRGIRAVDEDEDRIHKGPWVH